MYPVYTNKVRVAVELFFVVLDDAERLEVHVDDRVLLCKVDTSVRHVHFGLIDDRGWKFLFDHGVNRILQLVEVATFGLQLFEDGGAFTKLTG